MRIRSRMFRGRTGAVAGALVAIAAAGVTLKATGLLAQASDPGADTGREHRSDLRGEAPGGGNHWLAEDFGTARPQLETHLRGLDVAMIEIGYRFSEMHFGGIDRNWPYVNYQLDKIELVMRQALERRPQRAESAQPFLDEALPAVRQGVQAAIDSRDQKPFRDAMERLRTGCMHCHVLEDVPHFTVTFPERRVSCIGPTS